MSPSDPTSKSPTDGAPERSEIRRRRFIGVAAGAAAGTVLGGRAGELVGGILASADNPLFPPKGPESFVLSVCGLCPGGCGVRARKIGDRVVKVDGNPLHPVNAGRLCPKGQAALQSLYHPDRVTGPLHRVGPRGALESFVPASWDEALAAIAERLRSLRLARRPESLALLRSSDRDLGGRVASRFLEAFGSPNDVVVDRGDQAATTALLLTQGVAATPAYDLQSAGFVLSLGSALLEASGSPVHTMRAYGEFRQGRTGRRGKLIHVESRLSLTAAGADEWISVAPGTEAVFGLGVASVIVSEGLYDAEFVRQRTAGFDDSGIEPALRDLLERDYPLERVALETTVPAHVILRVAREFAATGNGLAVGPRKGPLLPGALFGHLVASVLNGLVGSIDAPGGQLVPEEVPLPPWPEAPADALAADGRGRPRLDASEREEDILVGSDPEQFAEAILTRSPVPVDTLFVLGADPVLTSTAPERFVAALNRVPLVVSFANLADDTALHADWILPEAHFLERWDLQATPAGVPYPLVSLSQPASTAPVCDVRPAADVLLDLARRVGPEVGAALPWSDSLELVRAQLDGLYRARRGALMGSSFDEAWVRMMERAGWWAPGYRSADELWQKAQQAGGWWDPFYDHGDWRRVLTTPSGRFEFRADLLERLAPRPDGAPSRGSDTAEAGSFALILFEPLPISGGRGSELPFLAGILDPGHEAGWETWIEINPRDAEAAHIADRAWVRVTSASGAIVARARVTPRVVAGAVALPIGLGKRGGGRWASGLGANPLELVQAARDRVAGIPDPGATRVQIGQAESPGG